jgi:hypothetical protein
MRGAGGTGASPPVSRSCVAAQGRRRTPTLPSQARRERLLLFQSARLSSPQGPKKRAGMVRGHASLMRPAKPYPGVSFVVLRRYAPIRTCSGAVGGLYCGGGVIEPPFADKSACRAKRLSQCSSCRAALSSWNNAEGGLSERHTPTSRYGAVVTICSLAQSDDGTSVE